MLLKGQTSPTQRAIRSKRQRTVIDRLPSEDDSVHIDGRHERRLVILRVDEEDDREHDARKRNNNGRRPPIARVVRRGRHNRRSDNGDRVHAVRVLVRAEKYAVSSILPSFPLPAPPLLNISYTHLNQLGDMML